MPLSGLRAIGFDRHAAAAAVAALAAAQLRGDGVEVDGESGRHAFENRDERLAVRLAGSEKSQHRRVILSEKFARPGRAPEWIWRKTDGPTSCTKGLLAGGHVQLIADRFASMIAVARSISPRANACVWLLSSAGGPAEQTWAERCAWFSSVTQPSVAPLVDYGGSARRSALSPGRCSPVADGSGTVAGAGSVPCRAVSCRERARADYAQHRIGRVPRRAVMQVVVPDAAAGSPSTNSPIPARATPAARAAGGRSG